MKTNTATVIGAGINGLVAANYLQRAGYQVTVVERKEKVGGACTVEWMPFPDGKSYPIPTGASVFGMMQDFIFEETGLKERVSYYRSPHPKLIYFGDESIPLLHFDNIDSYAIEAKQKWGETGKLSEFSTDLEKVRNYLLKTYREAHTPSREAAVDLLGMEIFSRWISGSARDLLNHYFTSDRTKIYEAMPVTESGPVDLSAPGTALSIALMSAGSVIDGYWGFVNGGLWKLPLTLSEINSELGVQLKLNHRVTSVDPKTLTVTCQRGEQSERIQSDAIFFATDPKTAAHALSDHTLIQSMESKQWRGSSGKIVLIFREPVRWKGDTGQPGFSSTIRYLYQIDKFDEFQKSNAAVHEDAIHYSASSQQVYVEGAAMREMGWAEPFDYLSVFCKDFGFTVKGEELSTIQRQLESNVLSRIENIESFVGSVFFAPKDLEETFFFPEGNIDHLEITQGQTFFARTFSSCPEENFYQFGNHRNIYLCAAGSFPCGSVSGTAGYMAVKQFLRRNSPAH